MTFLTKNIDMSPQNPSVLSDIDFLFCYPEITQKCLESVINQEIPPGWYPDPDGKPADRYWNGSDWTSDTRPHVAKPFYSSPTPPKKSGVDSNEIALMVGIMVLLVIVAFGYDY